MRHPRSAAPVFLLLLPSVLAIAGGWAVVSVENPPEFGVAGTTLPLRFAVRQHGVTPLKDLQPVIEARSGSQEVRIAAKETGDPGTYVASLVLPESGSWSITIRSGFGPSKLTLLPLPVIPRAAKPPAPLFEVERGRVLFVAKGCVGCHVRNELGGAEDAPNFGPDLTGKRFEKTFLSRWLADPGSMGPPRYDKGPMPNPHLTGVEIAALSVYLNSPR